MLVDTQTLLGMGNFISVRCFQDFKCKSYMYTSSISFPAKPPSKKSLPPQLDATRLAPPLPMISTNFSSPSTSYFYVKNCHIEISCKSSKL